MERWARVKEIHQAALDREPPQRAAFLDAACAGDEALRREVQSLLAREHDAAPFLESPAVDVAARSWRSMNDESLVGQTISHYQVESLLGTGGMGEVYLARDPRLDRTVALKILPADLASDVDRLHRFMREARAASALNHPNVATIHDIGESGRVRFIVMEYVEGQTLAATINGRPMSSTMIVDVAMQVADALDAAQAKGVTHRDIKPANLMITPTGRVKVLDFGVAKTARSEERPSSHDPTFGAQTTTGMIVGSLPYLSPEQIRGHHVDHRSDLFSLGVTLYEMATGKRPFSGVTTHDTLERILFADHARVVHVNAAVPLALERIIDRCLQKDVERRYQSARELLLDLQALKRDTDSDLTRSATVESRRDNLPAQITSFVGRERERHEVSSLLESTRLLTLTGAGGCGKTRLALQVAADVVDRFRDGVWAVDLGPLSEPKLIVQTVAATLGVRGGPNRSLSESVADFLRPREILLVLDNCEHMIGDCVQLVEPLLRAAPQLHVLATSREALSLVGETVWRVPSLSVPDVETRALDASVQCEAVRLFLDRAVAVQPAFVASETNAAAVADICRRLDGIPLAIELAAARLNVLSVDQISARLKDRFRLLAGGSRTAVARQRTLEATIDWSYELLSEQERTLLCRLSVFPGGWTLDAAEDVCSGNGIERDTVLDLLSRLVDKSLVNVEDDIGAGRRYRCLETVRQYGRDRLVRSGDAERVRNAHLAFFMTFAKRAEPEIMKADQAAWLKRLQIEHGNLRSALEWCFETPGVDAGLELAASLSWFWIKRGYFTEGRQWVERAFAAAPSASAALRAKALTGLGLMTFFLADYPTTSRVLEEGERVGREAGSAEAVAMSFGIRALTAVECGRFEESARLAAAGREVAIIAGPRWFQGPAVSVLSYQAMQEGDIAGAIRLEEEMVAIAREAGEKYALCMHLIDIALYRLVDGQAAQAEAVCHEGIAIGDELGDRLTVAYFIACVAGAQAAQDRSVRAVRLWGAMLGLLDSIASPLQESVKTVVGDRYIEPIKASMGDESFQRVLSEGRRMSAAQAIQYALNKR